VPAACIAKKGGDVRKLVLFFVLGILAYLFAKILNRRSRYKAETSKKRLPERMVACGYCGIHVPQSEALLGIGMETNTYYCCVEHRNTQTTVNPDELRTGERQPTSRNSYDSGNDNT